MQLKLILGITAVICAALLSFILTPIVRVLAFKIGAVDVPRDKRRMHKVPTPRIGGLAIFLSFALTALAFCEVSKFLAVALYGALILVIMGVLDDVYNLNSLFKLCVQVGMALFAIIEGVRIEFIVFGEETVLLGGWSYVITLIWIVGLTNSVNLIDGLDGLACGVSMITAISLFVVTLILGDLPTALFIAVLIGACLGFLPYNSHPAKIFMGDTGSQALGFILAVMSVNGVFKTHMVLSFLIPISIFGLPLFDTFFAFARRILHGKNPFSADRGHIHHKLIDMGFGQTKSVRILYSICGVLGIASILLTLRMYLPAVIILISGFTLYFVCFSILKSNSLRGLTGLFDELDAKESGVEISTDTELLGGLNTEQKSE